MVTKIYSKYIEEGESHGFNPIIKHFSYYMTEINFLHFTSIGKVTNAQRNKLNCIV